jgi:hypothetical protein
MSASNLAAIFTPNILRPLTDSTHTSEVELANHAHTVTAVEALIAHSDMLGTPPLDVLRYAQSVDEDKARALYTAMVTQHTKKWWCARIACSHVRVCSVPCAFVYIVDVVADLSIHGVAVGLSCEVH